MYKKSINWDNLNIEMKLRYQDKINDDDNFLEYISKYHLPNLKADEVIKYRQEILGKDD